jgi:hypothetical protein
VAKSKKKPETGAATAAERRATLERIRAEERAKARRRTAVMVAPALVLAVVVGVMVFLQFKQASKGSGPAVDIGAAASAAGCQPVVTKKAEGKGVHEPEGQTIDYPDSPPADGPHWAQYLLPNQIRGFWETSDRPPVERLVHSLEHGYTILWYDETIAKDDNAVKELKDIADALSGSSPDQWLMVAPWTADDAKQRGSDFPAGTHLALTHWSVKSPSGKDEQTGVWQYCGKPSGQAVQEFMKKYPYSDSPEGRNFA